jgi:ABC-type multidrug transport system permease subunit
MTIIAAETVTIVIGGLLYLILLITLGILSIRKGHWVMFIIGIFIPLFWLIGALLPPTASAR